MVKALRLRVGIGALVTIAVATFGLGTAGHAAPGDYAAGDVNTAVAKGVAYLDTQQNANGSFGSTYPGAETAFALLAYGVLDKGDFTFLPAAQQTHVKNAVAYLLGTQSATDGSFDADGLPVYETGLALDALSVSTGADPGIPAAITAGRGYLIAGQQAPSSVTGNAGSPTCSTTDQSGTDSWCGGWNYGSALTDSGRSDESNTGFALTGLAVSGGIPAAAATINVDWQRHVQELMATNYFAQRNDGGGDYQPGGGGFSSTANDTGSLLFGLGFDKVAASDAKVQAAMKFGTDVLDTYELNKATTRSGIAHSGMQEDGSCTIGASGCDWAVNGDGGYHYSLWALTKGFGQYVPPNLSDPTNWYAKVVDLLLSEQGSDGSWPADGRDDGSIIGATSLAIDALGLVGVPTHNLAVTKAGTGSGSVTSTPPGIDCGATCSASFTQGTSVTLTATADPGSTFAGWSGDCTGTTTCSVTMDADHAVTATFTPLTTTNTLAVTKDGTGSGTVTSGPSGIDCGTTCSASFAPGTGVALNATADPGSTFAGWSGDCTGTTTCSVTMDADHAVTATFTAQATTHTLTVTKADDGTGSVTSAPPGIDCGATCSAPFADGTQVTLTATADPGSTFVGWSGDCTGITCTVTMDADHAVTATFMKSAPPECKPGHGDHDNKDCRRGHDHFHAVVIVIVFTRFANHFCHWWNGVWSGSNFGW